MIDREIERYKDREQLKGEKREKRKAGYGKK